MEAAEVMKPSTPGKSLSLSLSLFLSLSHTHTHARTLPIPHTRMMYHLNLTGSTSRATFFSAAAR